MSSQMVAVLILLATQNLPSTTADEPLSRALESRRGVIRGELVIDAVEVGGRNPPPPQQYHLWFDDDRMRCDCALRSEAGGPLRRIRCRNCPSNREFIRYDDEPERRSSRLSLQMVRMTDIANEWYEVVDPRALGFVPNSVAGLGHYRMDSFLGRRDVKDKTLVGETWKGQPCQRIEFTLAKGVGVKVWVVPSWGDSVVKVVVTGIPATKLIESVESEVERVGPAGPWFPTRCTYTRMIGGELEKRQVAKIGVRSLNAPIEPKVFTLAGMNLPSLTPVVTDSTTPGQHIQMWDGENLVDSRPYLTTSSRPSVVPRADDSASLRTWLWLGSGMGVVVATLALWRLRRRSV